MPRPFVQLSRDEFLDLLRRFQFTRRINAVHMHHTAVPRHRDFQGLESIEAMFRHHTTVRGFADIAQHVTIAPDGTIWTGRSWNAAPASSEGHNGNREAGPFMFETVGNFNTGEDPFGGEQKETVLEVIARVQKLFNLPPELLRFHRQLKSTDCPGSAIDFDRFLEEVRERHRRIAGTGRGAAARAAGDAPFSEEHAIQEGDGVDVSRPSRSPRVLIALETLAAASLDRAGSGADADAEPPEENLTEEEVALLTGADDFTEAPSTGRARGGGRAKLTAEQQARLRPHVVNLKEGRLIEGGDFFSLPGDVEAIFGEHLEEAIQKLPAGQPFRLLFFAHGGLVPEASGLAIARKHVDWWLSNGIYPIYFVWETGFFQTIGQLLRGARPRGFADTVSDPILESVARRLGGVRIWSGMKSNAEVAARPGNGADFVADQLKAFCDRHNNVELHAVGHSAGAIFHAHFLPAAFDKGVPAFESAHFLAPAIRVDTFLDKLAPHIGQDVKHLTMYTMKTDFERDDHCARIYRKSLLYLIRFALEADEEAEILGLEESARRNPDVKRLLGLGGNPSQVGQVIFSKSLASTGKNASQSTTHGGFDDDAPTMNSVALRVLKRQDNTAIKEYPRARAAGFDEDIWGPPDLSDLFPEAPTSVFPIDPLIDPVAPPAPAGGASRGSRRALCVGINEYRDKPLGGCVADARLWERTLQGLGFSTTRLLDGEATFERLRAELRQLVSSSRPGDVVVFQYAGHGTQAPDVDGDETDDEAGPDEALCPVDCHNGPLLIDDDIAEILAELPDGVNFTFFMDNCNSGGVSRFGFGAAPRAAGEDARSRFLPMTEEMKQAYVEFRKSRQARGGARAFSRSARRPLRGVLFAACQADELAWEVNGQGEFTVRATPLLQSAGIGGLTNREFQDRVLQTFGSSRRQTPQLRCEDEFLSRPLLSPLGGNGAGRGLAGGTPLALADEIQRLAERLRGFHG